MSTVSMRGRRFAIRRPWFRISAAGGCRTNLRNRSPSRLRAGAKRKYAWRLRNDPVHGGVALERMIRQLAMRPSHSSNLIAALPNGMRPLISRTRVPDLVGMRGRDPESCRCLRPKAGPDHRSGPVRRRAPADARCRSTQRRCGHRRADWKHYLWRRAQRPALARLCPPRPPVPGARGCVSDEAAAGALAIRDVESLDCSTVRANDLHVKPLPDQHR